MTITEFLAARVRRQAALGGDLPVDGPGGSSITARPSLSIEGDLGGVPFARDHERNKRAREGYRKRKQRANGATV